MKTQKSIGLTIFAVCCGIYARSAFLAPTEEEMQDPLVAERSRIAMADHDPLGAMHDLRKYVIGVGILGLLIAAEDWFNERGKKKEPNIVGNVRPERSGAVNSNGDGQVRGGAEKKVQPTKD